MCLTIIRPFSRKIVREGGTERLRRFLVVAKDPKSYRVTAKGRQINVDGAILIWGACDQEGRREVVEGTGIAEVLSLEEIIETLVNRANPEYLELVQRRMAWCQELFSFLSGSSWNCTFPENP